MRTVLYLGSDPACYQTEGTIVHYPVIKIVPRSFASMELDHLGAFTHILFTSKHGVDLFFELLKSKGASFKIPFVLAIGKSTAARLSFHRIVPNIVAKEETQEGMIRELLLLDLKEAYFFFPRSSISRPVIVNFFQERGIRYEVCNLYDTLPQKLEPVPDLKAIDEIVFTSPSTIDAFLQIFPDLPQNIKLTALGPITERALLEQRVFSSSAESIVREELEMKSTPLTSREKQRNDR